MRAGPLLVGGGDHKVIAVHGWFGGSTSWSRLWPYLDTLSFSYAFVDCRGYGDRRDDVGDYTMDEAASDALAAADVLGWGKFSVVGHSMGGMIAQAMLKQARQRVRRLVGISPVHASGSKLGDAEAMFRRAITEAAARRAILDTSTAHRHSAEWLDLMVRESLNATSPRAMDAYLTNWTRGNFQEQVKGDPTHMRVIVGEHDPSYPETRVLQTWGATYPHCEIVTLSGAGHYPMDENPASLVVAIEQFLRADVEPHIGEN